MRENTGRRHKSADVCGNIIRLDYILRILTAGITPLADLNVHLTMIRVCPCVVPGEHSKHCGSLQLRGIPHDKRIGSISEAAHQTHFRAGPTARAFCDTQMKGSTVISPCVSRVVIITPAAAAWGAADPPLVSAEPEGL